MASSISCKDPAAFDAECVGVAVRYLAQRRKGALLYLPISFTSLVRPSLRHGYEALLADLPKDDVPSWPCRSTTCRATPPSPGCGRPRPCWSPTSRPSTCARRTLNFEIEKLPAGSVNSVTLILPEGDPLVRLSALRRFGERIVHYKQRRIWPAVSNVRRRAELEAAARLHIPFVTGPAICPPMASPVGGRTVGMSHLPLSPSSAGHLHNLARTG